MALPSTPWSRFRYALKVASWPKLFVPTIFGQTLGLLDRSGVSLWALVLGLLFTLFDVSFVVLLNDWGDREVDAIKREMFPEGCSPKTIPDGILPSRVLLFTGLASGFLALGVAGVVTIVLDRPSALALGALCLALFVAYTLPPFRLNYRGGGEALEMLGVGVALPLFQAYVQAGGWPSGWVFLPGYALLSASSAIASGLSDEESDRRGGKRTLTTALGNRRARRGVELAFGFGTGLLSLAALLPSSPVPLWCLLPFLPFAFYALSRMRQIGPSAVRNAFEAQARYKRALHVALWRGMLVLALAMTLYDALFP